MTRLSSIQHVLALVALVLLPTTGAAQALPALDRIGSQAELDRVLADLDARLFTSYNECDLVTFQSLFSEDVEFYHDQGGVTRGRKALTESIRANICGADIRRELVAGTLEAHYMKGYGAVQIGVHRFLHPKSGEPAGEARFVHLWQSTADGWKITRAISFDHHAAE